jgi:hypothetical protein
MGELVLAMKAESFEAALRSIEIEAGAVTDVARYLSLDTPAF